MEIRSEDEQWYYHFFYAQQPDLNWRNPEVKNAMFDVTRWWYKRGIAGFRFDAVDTLYEDPALTDNPVLPGKNIYGDPNETNKYNDKLPEVHTTLEGLRQVANEYNAVLIGETWTDNTAELKQYYGDHADELQMPMDFMFTMVNKVSAPDFRKQIAAVDGSGGWPIYVVSNHDIRRVYDRYGDGQHNDQIAKLMATLYLTLRGTPILYYGEELGMENNDPKRREDVKDPIGQRGWPKEKGRDGERTPMQWSTDANAGFSTAAPWNPVDPRYKTYNVETEKGGSEFNPESLSEADGAPAHRQSAARREVYCAERKRSQCAGVCAQLPGRECAGGAEHEQVSAEGELGFGFERLAGNARRRHSSRRSLRPHR